MDNLCQLSWVTGPGYLLEHDFGCSFENILEAINIYICGL